ncbi:MULTISPECIES: hypothetical protein [Roseateles]|uniref:Uncharacterized protein n=1 Tax=Pelomonas aquatica TaxID=431058 RepID=A0ABU1ZB09_9BURK|nr:MULTISPECIES: hypothetical protein [Roseateles]KQY88841.1 hypothetical protein ASD35_15025 [Pelomonas sp. Root1444]MDR7297778.1 hypothetical protein [Pelomonas aquatica]
MNHRWLARILVVALHAALLAALWLHKPARLDDGRDRRLTAIRLVPPRPDPAPRPAPPLPPRAAPRTALPDLPAIAPPAFSTEPEATAAAPAPTVAVPPVPLTPPAEPPRTTLRLTLPPGYAASSAAARNPALSDPRSNTPRLTLEDRIADATGGAGAWVEEQTSDNRSQAVGALGEYRTVMRRGNTCVEIFRSRISDTDPFNGNVAPRAGKMMGKPYKCR